MLPKNYGGCKAKFHNGAIFIIFMLKCFMLHQTRKKKRKGPGSLCSLWLKRYDYLEKIEEKQVSVVLYTV